jgi:thiamine phosphate synthase YjbQ (UPF0047 family)
MKSLTEYLWFEVPGRRGFINITPKIEELVSQSGSQDSVAAPITSTGATPK